MLNSGKNKKNILTLVLSEIKILNETKNHNPPPFKLNGRSLINNVLCKHVNDWVEVSNNVFITSFNGLIVLFDVLVLKYFVLRAVFNYEKMIISRSCSVVIKWQVLILFIIKTITMSDFLSWATDLDLDLLLEEYTRIWS